MKTTRNFSIKDLSNSINGKIFGSNDFYSSEGFTGRFTFLNDAQEGDIVIRHWINGKGIEIAKNKNIACLITQNPKEDAIELAETLNFPLIVTDEIEKANGFALSWTINTYSSNSQNIAITGTNGKSTTSHLIYHILKESGFKVFTNTDAESEFNTLIDPMVSKLISDEVISNGELDFLVIEISEVQGWLGSLMKNHSGIMAKALNPNVGIVTNIAMDHIGLVNSIDEVFNEVSGFTESLKKGTFVYNKDDVLVSKLLNFKNENVKDFSFGMNSKNNPDIYYDNIKEAIFYKGKKILNKEELPFTSNHFIQNILSAIATCLSLKIPLNDIIKGTKNYRSLKRRFTKLNENPLIIDDFAHNPDGIKATVSETAKIVPEGNDFYVVCAIRGSRGETINKLNVEALVEVFPSNAKLIISSSADVVNKLNFVEDNEKNIFFKALEDNNIEFFHFEKLHDALNETYMKAQKNDVILLIGAQGMDPAEELLKNIL